MDTKLKRYIELLIKELKEKTNSMNIHSAVYTFSCFAEGHVGMDIEENESVKKGTNKSLDFDDITAIQWWFTRRGCDDANVLVLKDTYNEPEAYVLHVPNGIKFIGCNPNEAFDEMKALGKDGMDSQFLHRSGKVRNKLARWNFNVGDRHQDADIPNGKNTLYNFTEMPAVNAIRAGINEIGKDRNLPTLHNLLAEANVYYNDTCGIRYHGDEERNNSPVIGVNLGETRYIDFRSFYKHRFWGAQKRIELKHGDMYFMSTEAVGIGWLRKSHQKVIFRHRAGSKKFLDKHDKELARRDAKKDAKLKERERKKAEKRKQSSMDEFVKKKKKKGCDPCNMVPQPREMNEHTTYECDKCGSESGCV